MIALFYQYIAIFNVFGVPQLITVGYCTSFVIIPRFWSIYTMQKKKKIDVNVYSNIFSHSVFIDMKFDFFVTLEHTFIRFVLDYLTIVDYTVDAFRNQIERETYY